MRLIYITTKATGLSLANGHRLMEVAAMSVEFDTISLGIAKVVDFCGYGEVGYGEVVYLCENGEEAVVNLSEMLDMDTDFDFFHSHINPQRSVPYRAEDEPMEVPTKLPSVPYSWAWRICQYSPAAKLRSRAEDVVGVVGLHENLADRPTFAEIADDFVDFVRGSEVFLEYGPFDQAFLDAELVRSGRQSLEGIVSGITGSREWNAHIHESEIYSLDALCRYYNISLHERDLHYSMAYARLLGAFYHKVRRWDMWQKSFCLQRPRRQIFIDTNTTGPSPTTGHRIMEIAAVLCEDGEVVDEFWVFINPQRSLGWVEDTHDYDFLVNEELFAQIADNFVDFVRGSEVIVYYAPFDQLFLDAELVRSGRQPLAAIATKITCFLSWVHSNKVESVQSGRLPTEDMVSEMKWAQTNDGNRGRNSLGELAQYYGIDQLEQQGYNSFVWTIENRTLIEDETLIEEMQHGPVFMPTLIGAALLGKLYHRLGGR